MRKMGIPSNAVRYATICFCLWAALMCFTRSGEPVYIENEAREGIYVRAMFDTGNFILPEVPNHVECGEIIPDKPPLFHWLAVAATSGRSILTTGHLQNGRTLSQTFNESLLRFPSALTGVLTILSLIVFGRPIIGKRAAYLAAGCLLTSWQFVHQSRYGRVDMALTCFVTLTILFIIRAMIHPAKRPLKIAAAMSGLAVLSKGPLGIVLPGFAGGILVMVEIYRRRAIRWLGQFPWISAFLIWTLVALPWYLAAYYSGGMAMVRSQLITENLQQFTGTNGFMDPFYYVGPWLTDSFPWNLLALAGIREAWTRRDRGALFCVVWWFSFMLFFTVAAYKRRAYIFPALPASSLLAGYWLNIKLPALADTLDRVMVWLRRRWMLLLALCIIVGVGGALIATTSSVTALAGVPLSYGEGAGIGVSLALFMAALSSFVFNQRRHSTWLSVLSLWAALSVIFLGYVAVGEHVIAHRKSPLPLLNSIMKALPQEAKLTVNGVGNDPSMLLLFYFPDPDRIRIIPDGQPEPPVYSPGYYLFARKKWDKVCEAEPSELWDVIWHDVLQERGKRIPLLMALKKPLVP